MAATGTVQILGTVTGLPGGGSVGIGPLTITSAAAVGERRSPLDLASGSNTVLIPATAKAMIFIPPTANTQALILRPGDASGTGISLAKTQPTVLAFETAPASVNINAAAAVSGCEVIFV